MVAPSVTWTVIAASQVAADAAILASLMDAMRKNEVHLEEWAIDSKTAAVDHRHDGIDSLQLGQTTETEVTLALGAGLQWVPLPGYYRWASANVLCFSQIQTSPGTWQGAGPLDNSIFSDGANMRANNTAGAAVNIWYEKMIPATTPSVPTYTYTLLASDQTLADRIVDEILMQAYQQNMILIEEVLGDGYVAAKDHNHNNVNSCLVGLDPSGTTGGSFAIAALTRWLPVAGWYVIVYITGTATLATRFYIWDGAAWRGMAVAASFYCSNFPGDNANFSLYNNHATGTFTIGYRYKFL